VTHGEGTRTVKDSYDFEYDCQVDFPEGSGEDTVYSTIEISVSCEPGEPRMYQVDIYLNNTATNDIQSLENDMFEQVEHKMLADLAADGITKDMLIYP
jgi:hypothetical protein